MNTICVGDLEVNRLGYGAMRLPGPEIWGEPADPAGARAVLRRVHELGMNFIDTAWFYGPHVSNRLIAEVLHPYPKDLVIATKLGGRRLPDKGWAPFAKPEEIRIGCDHDLKDLKLDRIDVAHFRYMKASGVPFMETLDAFIDLQKEGKIRHIGLSVVGVKEIEMALTKTPIVTVQNLYSAAGGSSPMAKMTHSEVDDPEGVLAFCEQKKIAFLPYFPLLIGKLESLEAAAKRHKATAAQIAIAWLLARSPIMLPIPGTSSVKHLEENWAARNIELSPEEVTAIAKEARAS
jgi:aryl-alcohol dehydrogenase-like predicted oxidoreductase